MFLPIFCKLVSDDILLVHFNYRKSKHFIAVVLLHIWCLATPAYAYGNRSQYLTSHDSR